MSSTLVSNTALDHASCYRAFAAKDGRYDGAFFIGVQTTGIYCRPVCPARTPRESACRFFGSAAAAEAAGFRPCLRCRPELAPYALQENLAHAVWRRIAAGALNEGGLEELAQEVGLSSRQLRRVLGQHFGVTPIELAQTQRLLFAKKLLHETRMPIAQLALASGFRSLRRFNALFVQRYGMAPTALRRASMRKDGARGQDAALTLRLAYRSPYDWGGMLRYLAARAIPGVEAVNSDGAVPAYVRSVRLGVAQGWLRVTQQAQRGQLVLEVAPQLAAELMPLTARVRAQFDLDANPHAIVSHLEGDPLLAPSFAAHPGLRVPGAFDVFELALRALLGQQISVAAATTLSGRLVVRFGDAADTPWGRVSHHFPQASTLAALEAETIAAIGLPRARAEAVRTLARFAADGGLERLACVSLDEAVARLCALPGIGPWTAHYIALRGMRFPNAFPAGDLGLQNACAEDGVRPSQAALAARAERWSPWRAYAAMALWMR